MRKLAALLFIITTFVTTAQITPLNRLERGLNGQVIWGATSGTVTGVGVWKTPSLTVIGGTLTGTPIQGTLTIPSATTTPQSLSEVLSTGNTTGGQQITSDNTNSHLTIFDNTTRLLYSDGANTTGQLQINSANNRLTWSDGSVTSSIFQDATSNRINHDNGIELNAPSATKNGVEIATVSDIPAAQTLSIFGQSLSISGGNTVTIPTGSTTIVTGTNNITVTGSAPNFTVGASTALTNSIAANTSAVSTLSTNVATNSSAISTLSTNVTANTNSIAVNTSSITTLNSRLTQTVTNGVTTKTPSEDAVYDFIALRSSTITGLSANASSTITTATVASDLTFTVAASSTYILRGVIRVGCDNTGGVKIGVNWPTGTTGTIHTVARIATATTAAWNQLVTSGTLSSSPINPVNSTGGSIMVDGVFTTSTTAGTLEFIFGSITSGQTSTLYVSGTYLELVKIN